MTDTLSDAPPEAARTPDLAALAATPAEAGAALATTTVSIRKPRDELFAFFRDFSNLPRFMQNVSRIEVLDDRRSRWTVSAPGGEVSWVARLTEEVPGELLAWTSEEGADVHNSGRVRFSDDGPRGTAIAATITYDPPAGVIGKVIAKLTQKEPSIQARRDLRRFKQLMETGEIAVSAWTNEQARGNRAPAS